LDEALQVASGTNRDIQISKLENYQGARDGRADQNKLLPELDANVLAERRCSR